MRALFTWCTTRSESLCECAKRTQDSVEREDAQMLASSTAVEERACKRPPIACPPSLSYHEAMNCPICNNPMLKRGMQVTRNPANGKQYDHTLYHCETDDVWVTAMAQPAAATSAIATSPSTANR